MQIRTHRRRGRKISRRSRRLSRKVSRRQSLSRRRSKPHIRVGGGPKTRMTRSENPNPENLPLAPPRNRDLFEAPFKSSGIQKDDDPKKKRAFLIRELNDLKKRLYESRGTGQWYDYETNKNYENTDGMQKLENMRNGIEKLKSKIRDVEQNIEVKDPGFLEREQIRLEAAAIQQAADDRAADQGRQQAAELGFSPS